MSQALHSLQGRFQPVTQCVLAVEKKEKKWKGKERKGEERRGEERKVKERKEKEYIFWRRFYEQPSIILGCPGCFSSMCTTICVLQHMFSEVNVVRVYCKYICVQNFM